ncbi:hypothetical protein KEM63_07560 [Halopseudomonas nanhaiensis]|uniref:hypothetical protein n=1 Tax=Halopseudomonas nanhaiensis TaxID=2830842 RepID=UPI001CBEF2A3|nr:hypothetical protein [Halopseudomonas nanhaiensis]UAW99809.1 hypothetical protein KEM63_07560 [Halopseudomonas nanhaiensis]
MQKWTDRPPSKDPIDAVLESSEALIRQHASLLSKAVPPVVGFAIFLLYFYRNQFYPSFDLFQFSSLLLAAACIGFAVVGLVVMTMFAPGSLLFHLFINTKPIKEELQYAMPYAEEKRGGTVLQLIGLAYFGPFCLCGLAVLAMVLFGYASFTVAALIVPAIVGLLFGCLLQWRFDLPRYSFFSFAWIAYLAQLVFMLLLIAVVRNSAPFIGELNGAWHYPIVLTIPIILSLMVTICSMAHFGGWSAAMHFSLFFGIVAVAYSGGLTTLPEQTVRSLGLGAYEAEMVALDPAFCDRDMSALGISEDCALRDVHVVWSFGDAIILRPALEPLSHVQIPTKFVRSIIRSVASD